MRNLPKKPIETKGPKKRKQWNVSERFVIRRKKNLSFVAKLTQVSTAETQPNPTKKTRRNVSKRFLKKIQKNSISKLTQEPRYPIEIGGNLQKKNPSSGRSTYRTLAFGFVSTLEFFVAFASRRLNGRAYD